MGKNERIFEHFPIGKKCPVCGGNDDGWTILIPVDGTTKGRLCEAIPIHTACLSDLSSFRYNKAHDILYLAKRK